MVGIGTCQVEDCTNTASKRCKRCKNNNIRVKLPEHYKTTPLTFRIMKGLAKIFFR